MTVLMTPTALAVLAAWGAFIVVWFTYRFLHHHGGGHRAPRGDLPPDPEPWPQDAAEMTMPGAFLGAPVTDVIPRLEVSGTPPWAIPGAMPADEEAETFRERFLAARSEPVRVLPWASRGGGAAPIVAEVTGDGRGATLGPEPPVEYDDRETTLVRGLLAIDHRDPGAADRVFALMGGTT